MLFSDCQHEVVNNYGEMQFFFSTFFTFTFNFKFWIMLDNSTDNHWKVIAFLNPSCITAKDLISDDTGIRCHIAIFDSLKDRANAPQSNPNFIAFVNHMIDILTSDMIFYLI